MADKDFDDIAKYNSLRHMGKWYSWDSPVGLSIFFLTLVLMAVLVKLVFFAR